MIDLERPPRRPAAWHGVLRQLDCPLGDEPWTGVWRRAAAQIADGRGDAVAFLEEHLGLDAGAAPWAARSTIVLEVHAAWAGALPTITAPARADFERLVQSQAALRGGRRPRVPPTLGALLVTGLGRRRSADASDRSSDAARAADERLVLLSEGPYAGVLPPGRDPEPWRRTSWSLRLEHEAAHALFRRVFGRTPRRLLDEVLADWVALLRVEGAYDPDLAKQLLGVEAEAPDGGRLEVYLGAFRAAPARRDALGLDAGRLPSPAVAARACRRAIDCLAGLPPPGDEAALARRFCELSLKRLETFAV
ncbi:MAG: hypothetical protein AAGN46_10395 [Acidobacteriota bacterium]